MSGCEGDVRDWKTPSAIVDRPVGVSIRIARSGGVGGHTYVAETDEEDGDGFGGF